MSTYSQTISAGTTVRFPGGNVVQLLLAANAVTVELKRRGQRVEIAEGVTTGWWWQPFFAPLDGLAVDEILVTSASSQSVQLEASVGVTGVHSSGGGGGGATTLNGLTDVSASSPADGDALVYNAASGLWEPAAAAGVTTLDGLTDVNAGSPSDRQRLAWNDGASEWQPESAELDVDTISGTTHTIADAEFGTLGRCTNASGCTVTIPADATLNLPVGWWRAFCQEAAGTVTISAAGAATCNAEGSATGTAGQWAVCTITKVAANQWLLTGSIA